METKSIGSNGKYFRAVATPNREKPKEEEEESDKPKEDGYLFTLERNQPLRHLMPLRHHKS